MSFPAFLFRSLRYTTVIALFAINAGTVLANEAADAIRGLTKMPLVERTFRLSDMGFSKPIVLEGTDVRQEFFWAVPRGAAIHDAQILVDGKYSKTADSRSRLALSVNGQPQQARTITDSEGTVLSTLPVESGEDGFVRLGVTWQSIDDLGVCAYEDLLGNGVTFSPRTLLHYQIDYEQVNSIADAYAVLPQEPVILVADGELDAASFDAAWRVGAALERDGKRPRVRALPSLGSDIDASGMSLPAGLDSIPAFASLHEGVVTLSDPAQLAALIMVGLPAVQGDVLIFDSALQEQISTSFAALEQQLAEDDEAREAFNEWREKRFPAAGITDGLTLKPFGASQAIAVAPEAATAFAGLAANDLHDMLGATTASLGEVAPLAHDADRLPLPGLATRTHPVDVRAKAAWVANAPLLSLVTNAGIPARMVVDVAAAPGATTTRPVVAVLWNDVLLGAKQLKADGKPERLVVDVPAYALGVDNALRVQFQRQPSHDGCHETPQAYPATVLPSSYIELGQGKVKPTFVGVLPQMAAGPELIVPESWLATAPESLARIMVAATASGMSLTNTRLRVVPADTAVDVNGAFVSMDVPVLDAEPKATYSDADGLQIKGRSGPGFDIQSSSLTSVIEVTGTKAHYGLLWQSLSTAPAEQLKPFVLNRGDVVVLGLDGPVAWLDSARPGSEGALAGGETAFFEWRHLSSWGVPLTVGAVIAFLLLLWGARRARRRRQVKS